MRFDRRYFVSDKLSNDKKKKKDARKHLIGTTQVIIYYNVNGVIFFSSRPGPYSRRKYNIFIVKCLPAETHLYSPFYIFRVFKRLYISHPYYG